MTERQIQRWLRVRNQMNAPSTMKKFEDCSWHFLFYVVLFWYGLYTLWDKPWFAKTINCWVGWPKQVKTKYTVHRHGNKSMCIVYEVLKIGIYSY